MPHRDWYLATLGIVRYAPRGSVVAQEIEEAPAPVAPSAAEGRAALRQLLADDAPPTAAASASVLTPAPASTDHPVPTQLPGTAPAAAAAELSLSQVQGQTHKQTQKQAQPHVESAAEQPDEEIEARLAVWQPAPDLLFFDSLQPAAQPSLHMSRLVTNIAAALGRHAESGAVPQLLDWPPARSRAGGGLEAARTMVSAFCDARFSNNGQPNNTVQPSDIVQLVLILGADAARLLLPDQNVLEDGPPVTLRWRNCDVVVATSLSDMLGDPSTKRRVWRALAPFVRQ